MKKSILLQTVILFSVLLFAQSILIMVSINEMNGDAKVVNYAGLVRGATQRLVKLELAGVPNDNLIEKLDKYIDGLLGHKNEFNLPYMNDTLFQNRLSELQVVWSEVKKDIYDYRKGNISSNILLEASEKHFVIADDCVHKAEYSSEGKLTRTKILIFSGIVIIVTIVIISKTMITRLKKFELNQLNILEEKNVELDLAMQKAEKASKAKSMFLANMSHDIRTPLNGVMGMTQIALSNVDNPKKIKECLRSISFSSKFLLSLINNVLDMSKIEDNSLILTESEVFLPDFLETLIGITQQQIKSKNQTFDVVVTNVVHEHLLGDPVRTSQMFLNIISNAIKFTPNYGSISVSLEELSSHKEGYAYFQFICKDTGLGMSEDYKKRIFDSFTRETDTEINKIEGTGLGMSIVKSIVDAMGGQITVESEKGKGTTFFIEFHLKIMPVYTSNEDLLVFKNARILIIDDDRQTCENIVNMFSESGLVAHYSLTGSEALLRIENAKKENKGYNLVILDWRMHPMSGFEVAQAILTIDKELPIIVSSAYDSTDIEPEAKLLGITKFVGKPLFKSTITNLVREYLNNSTKTAQNDFANNFDFTGKNILIVEDNHLNMEIATEILSSTGANLECAYNGIEAIEKFEKYPEYYFDVILMDVQMPMLNGYEATKRIRSLPRKDATSVIIVAMTANAFDDDVRESKAAGMNEHVSKPLDFPLLKSAIVRLVSSKNYHSENKAKAESELSFNSEPELLDALRKLGINVDVGIKRFAGKQDKYIKCLRKFVDDASFVQLSEALGNNDINASKTAAHTFKGLVGNLAIDSLTDYAKKIHSALHENNLHDAKLIFAEMDTQYNLITSVLKKIS